VGREWLGRVWGAQVTMRREVKALARTLIVIGAVWAQAQAQAQAQTVLEGRPGIGIDSTGRTVIDPTKNVLDLVEQAIKRQDDLRTRLETSMDARLKLIAEISAIRSEHDRELLRANTDKLDAEARLRAEFATAFAATEKARVDAIRQVDKAAVDQAGSVATQTASNLAKAQTESAAVLSAQVSTSAEALRNLVATTAAESNRNIQQQFSAISTRIAALEQGSAQGVGERKFSDPAVASLAEQVRVLVRQQTESAGVGAGSSSTWAIIIAIVGLAIIAIGVIVAIMSLNRKVAANGVPPGG
jgi:hypothetical protein